MQPVQGGVEGAVVYAAISALPFHRLQQVGEFMQAGLQQRQAKANASAEEAITTDLPDGQPAFKRARTVQSGLPLVDDHLLTKHDEVSAPGRVEAMVGRSASTHTTLQLVVEIQCIRGVSGLP